MIKTPCTWCENYGSEDGMPEYKIVDADGKSVAIVPDPYTARCIIASVNCYVPAMNALHESESVLRYVNDIFATQKPVECLKHVQEVLRKAGICNE